MIEKGEKEIMQKEAKFVTVIDADRLGKQFFATEFNLDTASVFLHKLLTDTSFVSLFKALKHGYVSPEPKDFITSSLGLHDLDSGYFNLFLELAEVANLDSNTVMKVAVESFIGDSMLSVWQKGATAYILKRAEGDFFGVAKLLIELDPSFTAFGVLVKADIARSAVILIDKLLYGAGLNKSAIRKLLIANKIDINYLFGDSYANGDTRKREAIVRLALLYKTETECEKFLERVQDTDPNAFIRGLINSHNDRDKAKPQKPPQTALEELECCLTDGKTLVCSEFLERIKIDVEFNKLANDLFFSVYENDALVDIIVVEGETVCNLDNCPIELSESCSIGVLHPIEIPTKCSYLKNLNLNEQPILQIRRPSYFATDLEKVSNEIKRVSGTVVNACLFKQHLKEHNFKLVFGEVSGLYEYASYFLGEYSIVLEFTPTDFSIEDQTLTLKSAKIYKGSDFVPVRGNLYIRGARVVRIETVPPRQLSECIYSLLKAGNLTG
ncbi:MAG: DUF4132 domain-containing protein [Firmicutes bacterium]|nr:DUF4132 domain-containing protein [Bacillota bacterium]